MSTGKRSQTGDYGELPFKKLKASNDNKKTSNISPLYYSLLYNKNKGKSYIDEIVCKYYCNKLLLSLHIPNAITNIITNYYSVCLLI